MVLAGFALLILRSYRVAQSKERSGEPFSPEGKVRWSARSDPRR